MSARRLFGMKKRTFIQLLLSYLLILSLPIIVGSYAYSKTVNVVTEEAMAASLSSLEQTRDILDRRLDEVNSMVLSLSLDPKIRSFLNIKRPFSNEDYFKAYDLVTHIRKYKLTNNFIDSFYLYFESSESVITPDTIYQMPDSYGRFLKHGELNYASYVNDFLHVAITHPQIVSSEVLYNGRRETMVSYVDSLPAHSVSYGSGTGSVVLLIKQSEFSKLMMHNHLIENGAVYVLDEQGEVISAVSNRENDALPQNLEGQSGSMTRQINGESMVVTYTTSDYNGWTYVAVAPTDIVLEKVDYIQKITLTIVVLMLVFGIMVALWLAYRNSRPIRELMETIKDSLGGETMPHDNEYDMIRGSIRRIVDNNESMKFIMDRQLPFLQAAVFEKLFKGDFHNEKDVHTVLNQAKLKLEGKRFVVLVLHIAGYRDLITDDILKELMAAKAILKNAIHKHFKSRAQLHEIGEDKVACLLTFKEKDQDQIILELIDAFGRIYDSFYQQSDLRLSIFAGRSYAQLVDVWHSYKQAMQAMDYKNPERQLRQHIVFYDSIPVDPTEYFYPLDIETRLINTIKAGDRNEVQKLLLHLYDENFGNRHLSSLMSRQLVHEMRGTLIKLLADIKVNMTVSDQEIKDLFAPTDLENDARELYRNIENVCYAITEKIDKQKKSNNTNLIYAMIEYIQSSYMNADLSLTSIATKFNLTETYTSQFFKEQLGENFSVYLERLRMQRACELLNDHKLTISDIASQVGYNSDQAFRRAFKRVKGVQPSTYRKSDVYEPGQKD